MATATKTKTAKKTKTSRTRKAPASKPVPTSANDDVIQMIPLDKLRISPKNVRKVQPTETEDAEMLASVREKGIIQNLVGYEGDDGFTYVDAGGRRLKALQQLAEEGAIAANKPIPCKVEDETEATVTSTTENLLRTAMHPADQFEAFSTMIDEGQTEEDVARKFGVSLDVVRKRLKLARVAPEIIEQFRENEITLECVMAFTLTDNHDRQTTVWNAVKDSYHVHPAHIKRLLTETGHSANSKLGKFVGIDAYTEAGGQVMTDLFVDHDNTHLENPELLERLAIEKLQEAAKDYIGQWKWVDVHLELDHGAFRSFGRVYPQDVDPDPKLLEEIETLNKREAELAAIGDERDATEEEYEEYEAIEPRIKEIETQIEAAKPYADEDRALAGVVISISYQGELQVEKGLVRPEDIPAPDPEAEASEDGASRVAAPTSSAPAPVADPAAALRRADGITSGLADDLRFTRHHILRAHLSGDYDVAFDIMLYTMCQSVFGRSYGATALDLSLRRVYAPNGDKLVADSVADKMLNAMHEALNLDWMELDAPEDLRALSALPAEDKQSLFAFTAAHALKSQLSTDNHPNIIIEELGARMDVDVAACWRPTAANYWGTVTKAHIAAIAKEMISDDFADERSGEKKGEAAAAMERAFGETAIEAAGLTKETAAKTLRWLPNGMEFAEANFVDEYIDEDDAPSGEELPEFLKEETAA